MVSYNCAPDMALPPCIGPIYRPDTSTRYGMSRYAASSDMVGLALDWVGPVDNGDMIGRDRAGGTMGEATTVAIVGGGVAGLTAALLLRKSGIDCVVLERQSRARVEQRQRAGLVEFRGVRMFTEWGLAEVLGQFPASNTMEVRVDGEPVYFGLDAHAREHVGLLTPQQALVRNLITAFLADGGDMRFGVADVALRAIGTDRPAVSYT